MTRKKKQQRVLVPAFILLCVLWSSIRALEAESVIVTGTVSIVRVDGANAGKPDNSNAVVWLKPVSGPAERQGETQVSSERPRFKILQHHKRFEPHVLAIPVGALVDFPNLDPFFHNVFSMFDGKRFDLGLYEAGASHSVSFDKPGISFIFCNIHPEMSAVVVAVPSPYYAVSNAAGEFSIPNVPDGRYLVDVWHERGKPEGAKDFPREVSVSSRNPSLGAIRLIDSGQIQAPHKNKYGREYDPPQPTSPVYK